jgi:ABC-2 type transport system ATP-binding protein
VEIRVEGLGMTYGDVRAVDDVSFTVAPGEFFGLLGPNGAGKTTTLEMIEGLRKPQSGTVRIDEHEPWRREPVLQRRMGVQLQSSSFFERLTAREQLDTFGALYGVAAGRTDEMLEQVGLVDKAGVRTEDLSGGQKQRLSIACALIHALTSCSSTSPPPPSTRRPAATSGTSCARSTPPDAPSC